jgi:hypothetical protein
LVKGLDAKHAWETKEKPCKQAKSSLTKQRAQLLMTVPPPRSATLAGKRKLPEGGNTTPHMHLQSRKSGVESKQQQIKPRQRIKAGTFCNMKKETARLLAVSRCQSTQPIFQELDSCSGNH